MRVSSVIFSENGDVNDRMARALAIHEAVRDDLEAHFDQQWSHLKIVIAVATVAVVAGVAFLGVGQTGVGVALSGIGVLGGVGASAYVRSQSPDVTVSSIEKGYWTGHLFPDENGTVVFDATESIEPQRFQLNLLDRPDRAQAVEQKLDSIGDFPVVMTEETDVEDRFVSTISTIETEIENSETREVTSPVLKDDDPAIRSLSRLTSAAEEGSIEAGGVSLSQEEAAEQVRTFDEFESMANEDHGESVLLNVGERSRAIANDLSGHQERAAELMNDHIQVAGDMLGLVSYNFYCPDCMEDEIESQLEVRHDDGEWYCDTCRSNFAPGDGIPRHRIRDEIVLDVWDQLWIEKDDERRQVYESIEDQKAELEEREFEQRREEIRTVEERIKDIRSRIRDLETEARAKQGIVDEMGDLMAQYDHLKQQRIDQFRDDVNNAFREIDKETERVLAETEGVVENRIEEAEKEAEQKAEAMREEERQRQREFLATQQAIEEDRAKREQERSDARTAAVVGTIRATNRNKPERRGQ